MKRILLVIILLLLAGCNTKEKEAKRIKEELQQVRERVLREYTAAYPQEEFYFLYGPDYDPEIQRTNIRYRGILSTKTLEDLDYHKGFQINLEEVNSYLDTRKYQNTLNYLEIYAPLKKEAKEIFGEDIIFEIDGTYTSAMQKLIVNNLGKDLPVDRKTGFRIILLSTFVDDLDKELENVDYWKEKIYQLGKKYWEYYNILGALQIYLYDKELLYNVNLVENSLTIGAEDDKKIQEILKKLKAKESLENDDLIKLTENFRDGSEFLGKKMLGFQFFTKYFKSKEELTLANVEIKNELNRK